MPSALLCTPVSVTPEGACEATGLKGFLVSVPPCLRPGSQESWGTMAYFEPASFGLVDILMLFQTKVALILHLGIQLF